MPGNVKRFIGDVHGKFRQYRRILRNSPPSIQVGDMGIGFIRYGGPFHGTFSPNPPHKYMTAGGHRFLRGNHDNPGVCKRQSQWIPDGTVENDMMLIGGAVSIDRAFRIENYSWWADEEPSNDELCQMVDTYKGVRPRIMITHEIPESIADLIVEIVLNGKKFDFPSRVRQALQVMSEIHQPKLHLAGHWHLSFNKVIKGTRYIVLNELEWIDVDLDTLEIVNRGFG